MKKIKLSKTEIAQIDGAVALFESKRQVFEQFATGLLEHLGEDPNLSPYIHFIKHRVKDPQSLRKKLERKACARKRAGKSPNIHCANLFAKITDLAGVRILHLHTEQMRGINKNILSVLNENDYVLLEGPKAVCWDVEYQGIFENFGIATTTTASMYTSVHYIIEANPKTKIAAELQVRTLMDEVWGEVSHRVNYPVESSVRSCRDQLKVLARITSGGTRLVDSIFQSRDE
ncbi:MAG: RelA/SpoT domain-containing protein [Gammaproteobacteria bacterium]